jgi:hypothetical protein
VPGYVIEAFAEHDGSRSGSLTHAELWRALGHANVRAAPAQVRAILASYGERPNRGVDLPTFAALVRDVERELNGGAAQSTHEEVAAGYYLDHGFEWWSPRLNTPRATSWVDAPHDRRDVRTHSGGRRGRDRQHVHDTHTYKHGAPARPYDWRRRAAPEREHGYGTRGTQGGHNPYLQRPGRGPNGQLGKPPFRV